MTLNQLTATRASGAVVLIRLYVGLIFAGEGILKFVRPDALGPGRFIKAGIPAGSFFAYLDGVFEGCAPSSFATTFEKAPAKRLKTRASKVAGFASASASADSHAGQSFG